MKAKVLIACTITSLAGIASAAKVNDTIELDECTARNLAKKGKVELLEAKAKEPGFMEKRSTLSKADAKVRKFAYFDARKKRIAKEIEDAKQAQLEEDHS